MSAESVTTDAVHAPPPTTFGSANDLVPDWQDNGVGLQYWGKILTPIGAGLSIAALCGSPESLHRFSQGYLLGFSFIWTVVLGCLFFVGLQYATSSVWSIVVRRQAEAFVSPMVLLAILFVPILLFAKHHDLFSLFAWADPALYHGEHADPILLKKQEFLNVNFFAVRAAIFFLIWIAFKCLFVNKSVAQDRGVGGVEATLTMRRWSYAFLMIFALTITFASFDWLMSLWPHWFSTIYGLYVFSGMFLTGLSCITLAVLGMRKRGMLGHNIVRKDHLYSLGALQFAFTCFWAYIAFSQLMLIWYGNMQEETIYYTERITPGWLCISITLVVLRFVIPFFMLLSRHAKTNPKILVPVSWFILFGQLFDLYWLIMPLHHGPAPRLSWQEVGPVAFLIGVMLLAVGHFMNQHRALAIGDPRLEKSRHFHL